MLNYLYTPLTTISHSDDKIGALPVDLLFDQIDQKTLHDRILLPTKLIVRDSAKNINT